MPKTAINADYDQCIDDSGNDMDLVLDDDAEEIETDRMKKLSETIPFGRRKNEQSKITGGKFSKNHSIFSFNISPTTEAN